MSTRRRFTGEFKAKVALVRGGKTIQKIATRQGVMTCRGGFQTRGVAGAMWCIAPKQDAAFVCAMEQVLEVYKRPHDARRPVVCMDESTKQCVKEAMREGNASAATPRVRSARPAIVILSIRTGS